MGEHGTGDHKNHNSKTKHADLKEAISVVTTCSSILYSNIWMTFKIMAIGEKKYNKVIVLACKQRGN
jgi:hypothetical protein